MTVFYDLWERQRKQGRPQMKRWWECYVEGTNRGTHYHHHSLQSAQAEAERLARLTGKTVYLFECIGKCRVITAPIAPILWEVPRQ